MCTRGTSPTFILFIAQCASKPLGARSTERCDAMRPGSLICLLTFRTLPAALAFPPTDPHLKLRDDR